MMVQMNEIDRMALLCHLVAAMGAVESWAGETHIQKSVMFLQKLLEVPFGYQFVLYKHGPFSFDLRSKLAVMRADLWLDVEPHVHYGPSFTLGTWGEHAVKTPTIYKDKVEFVAREVATKDARVLERLSTAFFLKDKYPQKDETEIANDINRLKPHISVAQAMLAIEDAEQLRAEADKLKEN